MSDPARSETVSRTRLISKPVRSSWPEEWQILSLVAGILGGAAIVVFSLQFSFAGACSVIAVGVGVGGSAWFAGALLGFLFGIPRATVGDHAGDITSGGDAAGGTSFRVNTNLEQISDWLTKILVGVGLVQIGRAPRALSALATALEPGFGDKTASRTFALAISLYFSIAGFLASYLWAQLRYRGQLHRAERMVSLETEQLHLERSRPTLRPVPVTDTPRATPVVAPPPPTEGAAEREMDLGDEVGEE